MINQKPKKDIFALLIAGSRDYTNYQEFRAVTDHLLSLAQEKYEILIIEGEARGTDSMARQYAEDKGYRLAPFPADWKTYGKAAGLWRNELMADELTLYQHKAALFFWDQKSRGTAHCIGEVRKRNIPYKIFDFEEKKFIKEKQFIKEE